MARRRNRRPIDNPDLTRDTVQVFIAADEARRNAPEDTTAEDTAPAHQENHTADTPPAPRYPHITVTLHDTGNTLARVHATVRALRAHGIPTDTITRFRAEALNRDTAHADRTIRAWVTVA